MAKEEQHLRQEQSVDQDSLRLLGELELYLQELDKWKRELTSAQLSTGTKAEHVVDPELDAIRKELAELRKLQNVTMSKRNAEHSTLRHEGLGSIEVPLDTMQQELPSDRTEWRELFLSQWDSPNLRSGTGRRVKENVPALTNDSPLVANAILDIEADMNVLADLLKN